MPPVYLYIQKMQEKTSCTLLSKHFLYIWSMREKIALFCDVNSISWATHYQDLADMLDNSSYDACIVYNTCDFLVQWIRDYHKWIIDDEYFFQIGDITSTRIIKPTRPHLDAVEKILADIQDNTLYVIDEVAQIHYTHIHWSREEVEKKLTEKNSMIFAIKN